MKKRMLAVCLLFAWLYAASVSVLESYADANAFAFNAAGEGGNQWEWQPTEAFLESESADEYEDDYEDDHSILDDESVTHLEDLNLDLPAQGIELTLSCERHDFTQYVGSQPLECPMVYDLVSLAGNLPGIESINEQLYKDYETHKRGALAGFETFLIDWKNDPPAEYTDTVMLVTNYSNGDFSPGLQYYDGRYLSLFFDTFWCAGGVGESNAYCMTFDLQTGQKMSAADLFSNSSAVKAQIVETVIDTLRTDYGITQMDEYELTELNNLNLDSKTFFLSRDGELILCFDRYELGEGALGSPMIETGIRLGDKEYELSRVENYEVTFTASSGNIGTATVNLKKGFDFIETPSAYYNKELALIAVTLSAQVYNSAHGKRADEVLSLLGYDDADFSNNGSTFATPGACFAYKRINDGTNLFVVIVRGTDNGTDIWTDVQDGALSMFRVSGDYIKIELEKYMREVTGKTKAELLQDENYFFFTGHSLGGAVANYLSINGDIMEYADSRDNIYTYTFESPHTCVNLWWMNPESESNAYNFKVDGDAVTNLPPYIGATTYGKDVWIRVSELDDSLFNTLFPDAKIHTLATATSVEGHGDIYGLHDTCLGLVYIMQNN